MSHPRTLLAPALVLALGSVCNAADAPGFKVTKHFPIPGDSGFDYIVFDNSSNRLYVSHGIEVNVLDATSGEILGKVDDTLGVHGIAIVPALHRGFTTNGKESTVSVFDTATFKTVKKIPVPADPDFVFYDPHTNRVLVSHGDAGVLTAIDPNKETVIGQVPLGGGAEAAVVDGRGAGFVNLEKESTVVSFAPQTLAVTHKYPITGCETPAGLAIDAKNSRLFIGCRSKVMAVMDTTTGKVIATLPIGARVDAVAFDSENQLVFCSNGEGTVSVIHQKSPTEYESLGEIQTLPGAKTMALDPTSKKLFLSTSEMESVPASDGKRARTRAKRGTFMVLVVERQ